jgi:hypothetical protein
MGWLIGWTYRKSVTLSRSSGAVTNYPMKVLVGENSGASGCDVHCNGHGLSSFNDLRFTKSDGTTLLDYWIESISGTTPNRLAIVWVEFDSIGTSATTFYLYYGNSGASAVSNGVNTFSVFDDYEWGSDGTDLATSGGSITYQTPNNGSAISTDHAYGGTRSAKLPYHADYSYLGCSLTAIDAMALSFRWYSALAVNYTCFAFGNAAKRIWVDIVAGSISYWDGSSHDTGYDISDEAWDLFEIKNIDWTAGTYELHLNGDLIAEGVMETSADSEDTFQAWGSDTSGDAVWFDNLVARGCDAVEPSWGSWGAEDDGSVTLANVILAASPALSADLEVDLLPPALTASPALSLEGNLAVFIDENYQITYRCVLTGAADGLSDQVLHISSFQGRFRSGDPSFLSVVVPGLDYAEAINARSNGSLIVFMVKTYPAGDSIAEAICAVDLEDIRLDEGTSSASITLSGHRTESWPAKSISLKGVSYRCVTNGKFRCRCVPDLYIRPGDTVNVNGDSFTANLITWTVGAGIESMEVSEE